MSLLTEVQLSGKARQMVRYIVTLTWTRTAKPIDVIRSLYQFEPQFAANECGGTLQGIDRYIALGLENAVNLRTARVHQLSQFGLAHTLPLHFLTKLPSHNACCRLCTDRFAGPFFYQKTIQR